MYLIVGIGKRASFSATARLVPAAKAIREQHQWNDSSGGRTRV
jgi:hypothetical protein